MTIQFSDTVRVVKRGLNWELEALRAPDKASRFYRGGGAKWVNVGYYGSLRSTAVALLESHLDLMVPPDYPKSILSAVNQASERIVEACTHGQ